MTEKKVASDLINVGNFIPCSETNGPGIRAVLWLQGCLKRCRNCWNPELLSLNAGKLWSIEETIEKLISSKNIEGITLLGGEPFLQAHTLSKVTSIIRNYGYTVMAYSGYKLDELLLMNKDVLKLLENCDILVDGEYDENLKSDLLWRGSSNQKIHFLTNQYFYLKNNINKPVRNFEIFIEGNNLVITGDPPNDILNSIKSLFNG